MCDGEQKFGERLRWDDLWGFEVRDEMTLGGFSRGGWLSEDCCGASVFGEKVWEVGMVACWLWQISASFESTALEMATREKKISNLTIKAKCWSGNEHASKLWDASTSTNGLRSTKVLPSSIHCILQNQEHPMIQIAISCVPIMQPFKLVIYSFSSRSSKTPWMRSSLESNSPKDHPSNNTLFYANGSRGYLGDRKARISWFFTLTRRCSPPNDWLRYTSWHPSNQPIIHYTNIQGTESFTLYFMDRNLRHSTRNPGRFNEEGK